MNSLLIREGGQSALEQALLISVIALGLLSGGLYISRSMKAKLKMVENQVNEGVKVVSPPPQAPSDPYANMAQECIDQYCNDLSSASYKSTCQSYCNLTHTAYLSCRDNCCGGLGGTAACLENCVSRSNAANSCASSWKTGYYPPMYPCLACYVYACITPFSEYSSNCGG